MNKAWWLPLVMAGSLALGAENQGSTKEFVVELPDGIEGARRVVLELTELRLPKKAAVVLRVRAIEEDGAEVPLGSVGLLAQSIDAEGTTLHGEVRIDVTKAMKQWQQNHLGVGAMRVRVVPYAGAGRLATLEWSVESAALTLVR